MWPWVGSKLCNILLFNLKDLLDYNKCMEKWFIQIIFGSIFINALYSNFMNEKKNIKRKILLTMDVLR